MKEERNRIYEGDNDSTSRDSLRFYQKLNLNTYKQLYCNDNTDDSDSSRLNTENYEPKTSNQPVINRKNLKIHDLINPKETPVEIIKPYKSPNFEK